MCQLEAQARWSKKKYKHADKNKDGTVDPKERVMEKKWEQKQKSKVDTKWEAIADTDNDGKVEPDEAAEWKEDRLDLNDDGVITSVERSVSWKKGRSRVNTPLEANYDDDGDGWLEPDEVKDYLSAKYSLIQSNGKAKVDSPLEEEYDDDGDGIIDVDEAEDLKEDLED
jgi:hypothetical protein